MAAASAHQPYSGRSHIPIASQNQSSMTSASSAALASGATPSKSQGWDGPSAWGSSNLLSTSYAAKAKQATARDSMSTANPKSQSSLAGPRSPYARPSSNQLPGAENAAITVEFGTNVGANNNIGALEKLDRSSSNRNASPNSKSGSVEASKKKASGHRGLKDVSNKHTGKLLTPLSPSSSSLSPLAPSFEFKPRLSNSPRVSLCDSISVETEPSLLPIYPTTSSMSETQSEEGQVLKESEINAQSTDTGNAPNQDAYAKSEDQKVVAQIEEVERQFRKSVETKELADEELEEGEIREESIEAHHAFSLPNASSEAADALTRSQAGEDLGQKVKPELPELSVSLDDPVNGKVEDSDSVELANPAKLQPEIAPQHRSIDETKDLCYPDEERFAFSAIEHPRIDSSTEEEAEEFDSDVRTVQPSPEERDDRDHVFDFDDRALDSPATSQEAKKHVNVTNTFEDPVAAPKADAVNAPVQLDDEQISTSEDQCTMTPLHHEEDTEALKLEPSASSDSKKREEGAKEFENSSEEPTTVQKESEGPSPSKGFSQNSQNSMQGSTKTSVDSEDPEHPANTSLNNGAPALVPLAEKAPVLRRRRSSSPPRPQQDAEAPSLTLAIVSAWRSTTWARRIPAILASLAINVGLPFINGVMLGFGELFARNFIGIRLGWGNPFTAASSSSTSQRANTASVGLRGPSQSHHSGAAAKGVLEALVEEGEVLRGSMPAAS